MSSAFMKARREHDAVKRAAEENEREAGDLWNGITGRAEPTKASYAEAVRDTLPEKYEGLVLTDDIAAAFAFKTHIELLHSRFPGASAARVDAWVLRDLAREGWAAFAVKADSVIEIEQGFGWDTSAAWSSIQEIQTAGGDMGQVERVAKLAGRMFAALRGARATRVPGAHGEVYSVEQGRAIERLLPQALAMLSDADFEPVVLEQLAQRRAPQYAVRGPQKRSKGPLVVAIDESGSMSGRRNEWAKAAAVAIARIASAEGRPVSVVHYSTSTLRQPLKPGDAKGVVSMIKKFLNGGTRIALALDVSADEVRELAAKGQKGADVILISDGIDGDDDGHAKAIAACAAVEARLWTVAIECEIPESSVLRSRAASYVKLGASDLTDGRSVCLFAGAV